MAETTYAFDVGNTRIKGAKFKKGEIVESFQWPLSEGFPSDFVVSSPSIISSVADSDLSLDNFLSKPLLFERNTSIPIQLHYDTPQTLGLDRIAGAVGAWHEFKDQSILVIDLGSCVNYDFVDANGTFEGGVISPGFRMRMKAMHSYTGALPDITNTWGDIENRLPGKSTAECMKQGVLQALLFEINGFIKFFKKNSQQLAVILTGGDTAIFESYIKEPIFVRPKIVLQGLNLILEHNVAK